MSQNKWRSGLAVIEHLDYVLSFKSSKTKRLLAILWLLLFILSGAWTAPITHSPGDAVASADWNTYVRDNLNYLLSGRQFVQLAPYVGVADYSKTGAGTTTFADLDATNLILTLTPSSSRVRAWFAFTATISAGTAYYDIYNTTLAARGGDATVGLVQDANTATTKQLRVECIFTGLTPGVSTSFKLQFKQSSTANTVTVKANAFSIMGAAQEM
ncbi:MAG TPA: hypothetical protein VKQ72_09635 [Aggregatilineales bacterium]|nr:hypothetical protein [Aggregatilineales bacterium]